MDDPFADQARVTAAVGPRPVRSFAATLTDLIVIAAAVLIFLVATDVRTDLAMGWVDSALYHAMFLDPSAIQGRYGDVYWLSRWPWIATGYFFFALLPLAAASFAMTWVVSWAYGAAIYALARQFVRPGPAVVTAIVGGCNLYIVQTASAGYPSVAASALLFLGAALVQVGYGRKSLALLAAGGFAYGGAAMTHQFVVVPGIGLHLALLIARFGGLPFPKLVRNEGLVIAAALLIVPVSFPAMALLGATTEAFLAVGETTQASFTGLGDAFRKGPVLMLQDAGAYILLVAGVVAIVVSWLLSGRRWSAIPYQYRLAHLVYLGPLAAGLSFDFFSGGVALQYGFYQVFQIGGVFLQFGVLIDRLFQKLEIGVILQISFILAFSIVNFFVFSFLDYGFSTASVLIVMAAMGGLGCLAALICSIGGKMGPTVRVVVAGFVLLVAVLGGFSRYTLMAHDQGEGGAPGLQALRWVMDVAEREVSDEAPLFVAYDRDSVRLGETYPISNDRWYFIFRGEEYTFSIFDTLAGASMWGSGLLATTSGDFTPQELDRALRQRGRASVLVMWQENDGFADEIEKRLESHGLRVGLVEMGRYEAETFAFSFAILGVIRPKVWGW